MAPRRAHKPLLGFGPAGYAAAAVFLALLVPMLLGVDLRYEMMRLGAQVLGASAASFLTSRFFYLVDPTIAAVGPGFISFAAGLIAFHVASRRVPAWGYVAWLTHHVSWPEVRGWFLIICEGLAVPWLELNGYQRRFVVPMFLGMAVTAALLIWLTRSRLVAVGAIIATLLAPWSFHFTHVSWYPIQIDRFFVSYPTLIAWGVLTSCLITWAVLDRKRFRPGNTCSACGYSRAGLTPDVPCPECAATPAP